jgi:hypothetical protein
VYGVPFVIPNGLVPACVMVPLNETVTSCACTAPPSVMTTAAARNARAALTLMVVFMCVSLQFFR